MANTCIAFEKLAQQAAAARQHEVSTALQPMPQRGGWSLLDAGLHAASQETPAELRKWWAEQLASRRAHSLKAEIDKWKRLSHDLHVTSQAREHLRKLCAVEAAVGRGEIPSEMLTLQGWSAYARQQQPQQHQALVQARLRNTQTFQSTSPLQNGGAAWLPRVGQHSGRLHNQCTVWIASSGRIALKYALPLGHDLHQQHAMLRRYLCFRRRCRTSGMKSSWALAMQHSPIMRCVLLQHVVCRLLLIACCIPAFQRCLLISRLSNCSRPRGSTGRHTPNQARYSTSLIYFAPAIGAQCHCLPDMACCVGA